MFTRKKKRISLAFLRTISIEKSKLAKKCRNGDFIWYSRVQFARSETFLVKLKCSISIREIKKRGGRNLMGIYEDKRSIPVRYVEIDQNGYPRSP